MSTRDLLEVADDLLGGPKEAHWRSAVLSGMGFFPRIIVRD